MSYILHHETAPDTALRIARSKRCMAGPILSDSGLNVEIRDHAQGAFNRDQAATKGAVMVFQWDDPICDLSLPHGYPPNILYDQHPHRGFVPVGTTQHLKLIDIKLNTGSSWAMAVTRPAPHASAHLVDWALSWLPGWEAREAQKIGKEVVAIVRQQPNVSVVFPPENEYEVLLRARFANVNWP